MPRYYAKTEAEQIIRDAIVKKINALPNVGMIDSVIAQRIIEMFAGIEPDTFELIDNQIGSAHRDYKRGHLVRQVRNHPEYGRRLFAAMKPRFKVK